MQTACDKRLCGILIMITLSLCREVQDEPLSKIGETSAANTTEAGNSPEGLHFPMLAVLDKLGGCVKRMFRSPHVYKGSGHDKRKLILII